MKFTLITIGKVAEYAIYGFLILILFVILSPRLPTKNMIRTYIVPTGSMTPTVLAGSVVIVNPHEVNPKVGDIVAFLSPQDSTETVLHRVVEIQETGYKTKGDFNKTADYWTVPQKSIQGTLVVAIPYVGHIAAFVKKPLGFLLLAVIPALMLGFTSLIDIKNGIQEEYKKHKQKKAELLLAPALLFFSLGFLVAQNYAKTAYASFLSEASLQGISLSVRAATASPTPSPHPTPTPTPLPSTPPSPTPQNNCPVNLEIVGNGAGSQNSIQVHCETSKIVLQINGSSQIHTVHYQFQYDSDEGTQGVVGDIDLEQNPLLQRNSIWGVVQQIIIAPQTVISRIRN